MEEFRRCTKCDSVKRISLFRVDRQYITSTCQECHLQYLKNYRQVNRAKIASQKAVWHQEHKCLIKGRYDNDVQFKLSHQLRVRLNGAIRNDQKIGSAVKDLGCSIEELKKHLESKWQPGMTWNNWTKDGWHIDHIKPLSKFDLTDKEQFKKACHYTNLQPLWAKDNISKGGYKC